MKLALTAVAALLAASASAAPRPAKPARQEKTMAAASFEFLAPAGWTRKPEGPDRMTLLGPADTHGVATLISVRFVPPSDAAFPDLDTWFKRQTAPPLFEGTKPTEVLKDVAVAGVKARHLARDTSEFVPPSARNTKEVPMREELVALPAKSGFYLLTYYAPKTLHKKNRPVFESLLKSFRFKP